MFRARPSPAALGAFGAGAAIAFARDRYKKSSVQDGGLNESTFTPFTLIKKEPISSTSSLFTLAPKTPSSPSKNQLHDVWKKGIWSLQIKQPQLQIARAYTPLPPFPEPSSASATAAEHGKEDDEIRLLIRKERNGEVSSYLHGLQAVSSGTTGGVSSSVELRGPTVEYEIPAGDRGVREIVFLAGGTGIAPALQMAYALSLRGNGSGVGKESEVKTDMSILWANRRREDCAGGKSDGVSLDSSRGWLSTLGGMFLSVPPTGENNPVVQELETTGVVVDMLEQMKKRFGGQGGGKLRADYFVDEEGSFITKDNVRRLVAQKEKEGSNEALGEKLLIVSGPEGFVNHWAGPKQWVDGREVQGPVGGVLGQLQLKDWKIVKL